MSQIQRVESLGMVKLPELPPSWCWTHLKDISHRITDGTHQPPPFVESGIPFIFVHHIVGGEISFENTKFISQETYEKLNNRCPVEMGDILYSAVGSYGVAVSVRIEAPFSFQRHIAHIKPTRQISQSFLVYALNSLLCLDQAHRVARGVAQKTVTLGDLSNFTIPIPPLPEQHRIVAEIEKQFTRLDASVAALRRVQTNLRRYRASMLQAACEGRSVPTEAELAREEGRHYEPAEQLLQRILQERRAKWEADQLASMKAKGKPPKDDRWKNKYKEPVKPDTSELPELPEGWVWVTMDYILRSIQAGKSFKCIERPPSDSEVGVVKVSSVTWGEFEELESKTVTDDKRIISDYFIEEGNFLFSRANTIDLVGACVIVKNVKKHLMLSDKILRFRLLEVIPGWVLYSLRSRFGRYEIERLATGNQESMRNIGQDRIRSIRIPLPPLTEQNRIIAEVERRLSVIDELETTIDTNLRRANRLRQSILKRAFEGKLVPQDPTDEPASALLERIQTEREQVMEKSKARRKTKPRKLKTQSKAVTPVQGELALHYDK